MRGGGQTGRLSAFAAACPEAVERPLLIAGPPQQHIVGPSENFTFPLRSLGKKGWELGIRKCLGPARGMNTGVELARVATAVSRRPAAAEQPGASFHLRRGAKSASYRVCGKQNHSHRRKNKHVNVAS